MRSRVADALGIDFPLLQSGMGGVAGPDLAAAVSNAGGLGIVAGHTVPVDDLRLRIRRTRELTSKPFGVNVVIPDDLAHPAPSDTLDEKEIEDLQATLNRIRDKVGLEPRHGRPAPPPEDLDEKFAMLLEERIPVLSLGLGCPRPEWIEQCRTRDIYTIAMVSTVEDAIEVERAGIDAVVGQGSEAGGHRSHFKKPGSASKGAVGTMVLVPGVVDAVRIPVIAAGGIVDGRGFVASVALGAEGVMLGTRFVATQESSAVEAYKRAVLNAGADDTVITDVASGRYARLIENELIQMLDRTDRLPFMWHGSALSDVLDKARATNNASLLALWAGQCSGLIHDLPSAREVVQRIIQDTKRVLESLR